MSSIACVFPGQGSQHSEMLKIDLVDQTFIAEKIEIVSDILGISVIDVLNDEDKLNMTSITQPLLVLSSAIYAEAYKQMSLPSPQIIAGHSLGEYSALTFAESISFEDAIKITHLRGTLMQNSEKGMMMAILGLDANIIDNACSEITDKNRDAYVTSANYNSLKQTVIAGNEKGINKAKVLLSKMGAKRCIELNVSIASHSSLMKDAAFKFNKTLEEIEFSNPKYPIIQNFTGKVENNITLIKKNLFNQLTKPVLWTKTMESLSKVSSCLIEIGPKNVLCGLSKGYDFSNMMYMADPDFMTKVKNI